MVVAAARATETVVATIATAGDAVVAMDAGRPLLAMTAAVATWSVAGFESVDAFNVWCATLPGASSRFAPVELAVWASEV
jgi:hypothetical protein